MPPRKDRYYELELKNRVYELRKELNITQSLMAEALEVSRETITRIESGRVEPTLRIAIGIAKVLGRPVEEVFSYDADPWKE